MPSTSGSSNILYYIMVGRLTKYCLISKACTDQSHELFTVVQCYDSSNNVHNAFQLVYSIECYKMVLRNFEIHS